MKTFLIKSPCYHMNGKDGYYFSIAFTNENGDVTKGFGDHISEMSYGIKNVYESEGKSFSDEGRVITIERVEVQEELFDNFVQSFKSNRLEWDKRNKEELELFTEDPYHWVYGEKEGQYERIAVRNKWKKDNPVPHFNYYGFLDLIKL